MKRAGNLGIKSQQLLRDRIAQSLGYKDHADAVKQLQLKKEQAEEARLANLEANDYPPGTNAGMWS